MVLDGKVYLTVSDVVDILGCNRQTILRWLRRGLLVGVKFPGSMGWRIEQESVEAFIANREMTASAERELKNG